LKKNKLLTELNVSLDTLDALKKDFESKKETKKMK